MAPPDFQERRDLAARAAELERQLREVRRAIAAAERGRQVRLPELRGERPARPPEPAVRASGAEPQPAGSGEPRAAERAGPTAPAGSRVRPVSTDRERFAHYFGSSFLRGPPPDVERRVQRNRAIVMLVVVAILAYIVYSLAR